MKIRLLLLTLLLQASHIFAIPRPQTEGLEADVANAITEAHQAVEESIDQATPSEQADLWGAYGRLLLAHDFRKLALRAFEHAANLTQDNAAWAYYVAKIHTDDGNSRIAKQWAEIALQKRPDIAAISALYARILEDLDELYVARSILENAIGHSNDSGLLAQLGELETKLHNYGNARLYLQRALSLTPEADRLYYPLAQIEIALGNEEEARELLSKVGKTGLQVRNPLMEMVAAQRQGARIFMIRGQMAFSAGDYAGAIRNYRTALDRDTENLSAAVNLAVALSSNDESEEAIALFNDVLKAKPDHPNARFNLAMVHFSRGDVATGNDLLAEHVSNFPYDRPAVLKLVTLYREQKQYDQALAALQPLLETERDDAQVWQLKAITEVDLERFADALKTLETATKTFPEQLYFPSALVRILAEGPDLSLRDGERALNLANSLFHLQPDDTTARLVAVSYAELGDCSASAEWIRKVAGFSSEADASKWEQMADSLQESTQCRP